MHEKPVHPQTILEHTVFRMYKIAGHRRAFGVSYVRKSQIDLDILEQWANIIGQVRMSAFSDIVGSLVDVHMSASLPVRPMQSSIACHCYL